VKLHKTQVAAWAQFGGGLGGRVRII